MKPPDTILADDPIVFQMRTKAAGPGGRLPLNEAMLRDWTSGDLFGLTQNVGMGWAPAEVGRKLRARNGGFAARTTLMLYDETGDAEAVREVIAGAKG